MEESNIKLVFQNVGIVIECDDKQQVQFSDGELRIGNKFIQWHSQKNLKFFELYYNSLVSFGIQQSQLQLFLGSENDNDNQGNDDDDDDDDNKIENQKDNVIVENENYGHQYQQQEIQTIQTKNNNFQDLLNDIIAQKDIQEPIELFGDIIVKLDFSKLAKEQISQAYDCIDQHMEKVKDQEDQEDQEDLNEDGQKKLTDFDMGEMITADDIDENGFIIKKKSSSSSSQQQQQQEQEQEEQENQEEQEEQEENQQKNQEKNQQNKHLIQNINQNIQQKENTANNNNNKMELE